ncbi:MAG: aldehyde dehydrogenase family protein [Betaproteobacteria bacterium]|nr:aldehyde dehydrogenase family protein [Betaproteobacteria bacterium]
MDRLPLIHHRLLIDGERLPAAEGRTHETFNPATEELLAQFALADASDVDLAVRAARRALEAGPWSRATGAERARVLNRLADLLEREREDLVLLESLDAGKPLAATRRQDLPAAIECLRYYAGWADKLAGEVVPARPGALTYVRREPVGVVAAIVPWNFPLMNAVWKIAPALACGCTVVLKPAELTPLSALRLGELALEAGLPAGVLNVIPGLGTEAGQALVEHPGVDKIAFTGSPAVGKRIMATAAARCAKVSLELGGKSASIVLADADFEAAVRASASGIFFNAGQVCSAGSRLFVHRRIHDSFIDALSRRAGRLRMGDTRHAATTLGPLISRAQQQRVLAYVEAGTAEGAQCIQPPGEVPTQGFFVPPTIFAGARNDMRIAREEIFGPVATVIPFDDAEEAVAMANDSAYSLAAGLWTRDVCVAHALAHRLRAGTVWVNTFGPTSSQLPWGGLGGDSGVGRDLGRSALDAYTEPRVVWLQLSP